MNLQVLAGRFPARCAAICWRFDAQTIKDDVQVLAGPKIGV